MIQGRGERKKKRRNIFCLCAFAAWPRWPSSWQAMCWQFSKENNSFDQARFHHVNSSLHWLGGFVQPHFNKQEHFCGTECFKSSEAMKNAPDLNRSYFELITSNSSLDLPSSSTSSRFSMVPFLSCWCHPLVFIFDIVLVLPFSAAMIVRKQLPTTASCLGK